MNEVIRFLNDNKADISHFEGDNGYYFIIHMKNGEKIEFTGEYDYGLIVNRYE